MKKVAKNKKGQGHVEMMLSFVIFIGFLLFTFIFLNPFARTAEPGYIMDNVQKAIINDITDEVGKLSIILNNSGTCYNFSDDYGANYKAVLEESRKYTIYFYPLFSDNTKDVNCNQANYTLGVYSKEKIVIYNKTIDLKRAYESDETSYENLKKSLGITNDFLFTVRDLGGTKTIPELSVNRNIPQGIDVSSVEIPIRVINSNGQIQELILNIRVW